MKELVDWFSLIGNAAATAASALAFWVFFAKGSKVGRAIDYILSISFQTTLFDFKRRLERLNDFNAEDAQEAKEVKKHTP